MKNVRLGVGTVRKSDKKGPPNLGGSAGQSPGRKRDAPSFALAGKAHETDGRSGPDSRAATMSHGSSLKNVVIIAPLP